jgi:hypothetical protein
LTLIRQRRANSARSVAGCVAALQLRIEITRACQVRFDAEGRVNGHVPRPEPAG